MYGPTYQTKASQVPILSKTAINNIGENFVEDFNSDLMTHPGAIDIDRFLTNYLKLEMDYKDITHCGIYLGMFVFADRNHVPVSNFDKWRAEFISVKARTVIIDNRLDTASHEHRYRFTAAHEGSHGILHSEYFKQLLEKNTENESLSPILQCREDRAQIGARGSLKTDSDRMEWQENHLAFAILMPDHMVRAVVKDARHRVSVNAPLEDVAAIFNVSNSAANYRLKELSLI